MNAREVLEGMIRTDRGDMTVHSPVEVRTRLDAYRAETFTEGAQLLEDAACDADWNRTPDYCAGLRAGAELLLANTGEQATAAAATATPEDFFVAGRTYLNPKTGNRFICRHLDTDPKNGRREAWGWVHRPDGSRRRDFFWADDYPQWTLAKAGEGRG